MFKATRIRSGFGADLIERIWGVEEYRIGHPFTLFDWYEV